MIFSQLSKRLLLPGVCAALFACTDDTSRLPGEKELQKIDSKLALQTIDANLERTIVGAARIAEILERSDLMWNVLPRSEEVTCAPDGNCTSTPGPKELELEPDADELVNELSARVFNEANVESVEETKVTLHLDPMVFCKDDVECQKVLTAVPVRIELTSTHEGDIDADVFVGTIATPVVHFEIHATSIAVEASLSELKAAATLLAEASGEDVDELANITAIGRVRAELREDSDHAFTLGASVLEGVHVTFTPSDGEAFDLTIAVANPAAETTIDSTLATFAWKVAWNAIDAKVPLEWFNSTEERAPCAPNVPCEPPAPHEPVSGVVRARIAGATAEATLAIATDEVLARNIGVRNEPVDVTVDGRPLFSAKLNPNAGGVFDVVLRSVTDGLELEFTPAFDLETVFSLAAISDRFEDIPSWLMGNSYRVTLDGAAHPTVWVRTESEDRASGGTGEAPDPQPALEKLVEVRSGRLEIAASGEATVVVEAPQCLYASDSNSDEEPNPVSLLSAGACE